MFPWLYYWAPQFHYPFSGAVNQDIAPTTDWFFGGISSKAGDAKLEQDIFKKVASYGTQLGVLTDTVLWLAEGAAPDKTPPALKELRDLQKEVEKLKSGRRDEKLAQVETVLEKLAQAEPKKLQDLLERHLTSLRDRPAGS